MQGEQHLLEDLRDGVLTLTMNRPEARNALSLEMSEQLTLALRRAALDREVRAIVLTGAGGAFCAGGPVIAAVEGHAHGGGCELALMCDYIIASRAAVFSLPELRRGIMPGGGGIQNLVRAVGIRRAKKLLLTAQRFSAEEAAEWGMVTDLAEPGTALAAALADAREIVRAAPMATRYAKLTASRGGEIDFHSGYMLDITAYNVLVSSADRLEGVKAFNEKRPPRWRGG